MKLILGAVLLGLLSGCATAVPEPIRRPPSDNPLLDAVRKDPERYIERAVRWGGIVAGVNNRSGDTLITVVERPLDSDGRPEETDASRGRFLIRSAGFLDPAIYANGRELTVAGHIEAPVTLNIGEHPYRYVVVRADVLQLWLQRPPQPIYYYDPFWDPWYPWGYPGYPWPYRYHPRQVR